MRILVAHSRYQSGSLSGENRVVEDEVRLLREAGHDVRLWQRSVGEATAATLLKTAQDAVWSREALVDLRTLMAEHRPDVMHVHNVFPTMSPAIFRADVPVVATLHNYRLLCLPGTFLRDGRTCEACLGHTPWRGVVHGCYRGSVPAGVPIAASLALHRAAGTLSRPRVYLAVSRFVRDKHVEAGMPGDRIRVKPNFAWPSTQRRGVGEYFLFVGRLSSEKGLDTLMRAFANLPGHRLVVVGDGPERARVQAQATPNVEFRGAVDPSALPEIFAGARALVFPSTCYEGGPRSVVEAFAAGLPVVASDIGGLPELVRNDVSGILVPPGNSSALAAAIESLRDDKRSQALGEGAWRLWRDEFTPERALEHLEDAYRTAASVPMAEYT